MSLFENQTYENLLESALARVSGTFDKREGSMVYNGIAPAMAELARLYIGLDFVFTATYIATAPRDYLIERAKDRGLSPKAAIAAVFRAEFNIEVPVGTRFSCEELNFIVTERMSDKDTQVGLSHKVTCETAGSAANDCTGDLIPVEYIAGLASAKLVELLIPGDDDEETEAFRQRVLDAVQSQAFGGNQADYKAKVLDIDGVAAVKVHPVWNSDINPASLIPSSSVQTWYNSTVNTINDTAAKEWLTAVYTAAFNKKLTVGGTVKVVVMAADNKAPSTTFLDDIQAAVDPTQNAGEGLGFAPIGHVVSVVGVTQESIDIELDLTYAVGWTWSKAKSYFEKLIGDYFSALAGTWGSTDHITVRISQIESLIFSNCSTMITDVLGIKINGVEQNLVLDADSIPVRGDVNG